ncbi:MAG: hypothetical protein K6U03_03305 [Firmicutes bacterium]|nr:hypothetical protein [Bacillota bacterium]
MKRTLAQAVPGIALVCLGIILLVANLGLLGGFALVWPLFFACLGAVFLAVFLEAPANWWAAIPGLALLGLAGLMGLEAMAHPLAEKWGGSLFLAAIGLGFCLVYLARREEWWAIIPSGALFTLAAVAGLEETLPGEGAGAVFFLGLGLTFLLVRFLPGPENRRWALYPASFLILAGLALGSAAFRFFGYLWPALLIFMGFFLILREKKRGKGSE